MAMTAKDSKAARSFRSMVTDKKKLAFTQNAVQQEIDIGSAKSTASHDRAARFGKRASELLQTSEPASPSGQVTSSPIYSFSPKGDGKISGNSDGTLTDSMIRGERSIRREILMKHGFREEEIDVGNGNSHFRALAHLLCGTQEKYMDVREEAVRQLIYNPPECFKTVMRTKSGNGATDIDAMVKEGVQGDKLTLKAVCNAYSINIHVLEIAKKRSTAGCSGITTETAFEVIELEYTPDEDFKRAKDCERHIYLSLMDRNYNAVLLRRDNSDSAMSPHSLTCAGQVNSSSREASCHTSPVHSCLSPKGDGTLSAVKRSVTFRCDGQVIPSSRQVRTYYHKSPMYCCSFSPSGDRMVSGGADGTVKVWNAETGEEVVKYAVPRCNVLSCVFHPTKNHILSCWGEQIKILDIDTGKIIFSLPGHSEWVYCCVYSPSGKEVASASLDKTIRVWSYESIEVLTLRGHTGGVLCVCFGNNPNRKILCSASIDRTVKLWDLGKKHNVLSFEHRGPVWSCKFNRDDSLVLSASMDRTIKIWETNSGACLKTFSGHTEAVRHACFVENETRIVSASSDKSLKVWDIQSGEVVMTLAGHQSTVYQFSVFESRLLSCSSDATLKVWDITK